MLVKADFHNHSCLSPCASLEMSPQLLVDQAVRQGIRILALSDHNSALNTPAFEAHCRRAGILPLCGLEVTTIEELHCLCLFATSDQALVFDQLVTQTIVQVPNRPEKWGDQIWVDENDNILGEVEHYLGTATGLSLHTLGKLCLQHGGLFIPAHIDRPSQSVLSQLGYLPEDDYTALEIRDSTGGLDVRHYPLVKGSDAHYPENIASRFCEIEVEELNFRALWVALKS